MVIVHNSVSNGEIYKLINTYIYIYNDDPHTPSLILHHKCKIAESNWRRREERELVSISRFKPTEVTHVIDGSFHIKSTQKGHYAKTCE